MNARHLTKAQNFQLAQLVRDAYTTSGMSDGEFARAHSAAIGHELQSHHVADARAIFDIKNNLKALAEKRKAERPQAPPTRSDYETLVTMLGEQEKRIAALEKALLDRMADRVTLSGADPASIQFPPHRSAVN
jgi:hypothetical protein